MAKDCSFRYPNVVTTYTMPSHDYEVTSARGELRPYWPNDWEWRLDFPDIGKLLNREIKYRACKAWRSAGEWLGFRFERPRRIAHERIEYREVTAADIHQAVSKIADLNIRLMNEPIMLLIGMDLLKSYTQENFAQTMFSHELRQRSALGETVTIFDIPIIASRYAEGITILPDLAKMCRWNTMSVRPQQRAIQYWQERARAENNEYLVEGMYPRWRDDESRSAVRSHMDFMLAR